MMNEYKVQWQSLRGSDKVFSTRNIQADHVQIAEGVVVFTKNQGKDIVFIIPVCALDNIEVGD